MNRWQALYDLARRHAGVVTRADACSVGLSPSAFHRRVRRERWRVVFKGAWLVPGVEMTADARRWAAVLTSGVGAALSHGTAAVLLKLHRPIEPGPIHVVRRYGKRADGRAGLVRHRSRAFDERDRTTAEGLPVTTAARTIMDLADRMRVWELEAMLLTARQRGLLDVNDVVEQHERRRGLRGSGRFLAAGRLLAEDGADSILERRARRVLVDAGLRPSSAPHPIACHDGRVRHVDIAFPDDRFGIECDGFASHDPGNDQVFERDRQRWRRMQEAGWRLTWLTWRRLHRDPGSLVDEVTRALGAGSP